MRPFGDAYIRMRELISGRISSVRPVYLRAAESLAHRYVYIQYLKDHRHIKISVFGHRLRSLVVIIDVLPDFILIYRFFCQVDHSVQRITQIMHSEMTCGSDPLFRRKIIVRKPARHLYDIVADRPGLLYGRRLQCQFDRLSP